MLRLGASIPQSKPHPPGGLASNVVGRRNMVVFFPASDLRISHRRHHDAGGIDQPQVVVSAFYPGASAQVVADTVTKPLEQQINWV